MVHKMNLTIPKKYQVFDGPDVAIGDKDQQRLSPLLVGWPHLARYFVAGTNEPDLKRLVVLELMGAKRLPILERLLARLGKMQRKRIASRVKEALRK